MPVFLSLTMNRIFLMLDVLDVDIKLACWNLMPFVE
jgi:hypothetical protein